MSTFPVRISLVGAVLAAALAVTGCGDSTTVNDNISKFDSSSDQMSNSAWNVPTNLVNTYNNVDTGSATLAGTTETDAPEQYNFYSSFRKIAAEGDVRQAIGAIYDDFEFDTVALGRDGVLYHQDGGDWEVAFPAGINLNDSWVYESNASAWDANYYGSSATSPSDSSSQGGVYYSYPSTVASVTTTYGTSSGLDGITVAKVMDTNATVGTYTGVVKIVYNTTYRVNNLYVGSTVLGLDQFTKSITAYWKPGTGFVQWVETGTAPNYMLVNPQPANSNNNIHVVNGSRTYTYTKDLTASGVPANNG